jgi:8-oxo-dGTP pyrophosphatase MutT (NUDIX family)
VRDLYAIERPVLDVVLDGDWELVRCSRGRVVTSPSVDKSLDRPVVLDSDQYALPPDLAAIKPAVIAQSVTAPMFDGLNLALCEDPDLSGGPSHLRRVRYFDMMASNYLGGQVWLSQGRVVADLTRHLIADDGRLLPLSATGLGNQVGISTVALTTDGWMVLVHQSASSHSSPGLVAPSGSGCLEPQDVEGRGRLTDVVAAGMERELREELGLVSAAMREVRLETTVLGYGRWLEKGAKPEFYGFSRIHAAMRELDVRIDVSEREFVTEHVRIRPDDVRRLLAGEPFEALGQGVPSVPLELCLARLREVQSLL